MVNSLVQFIEVSGFLLLKGFITTFLLSLIAIAIGLCCGMIIGILLCRKLRIPFFASIIGFYVFCVRGIPFFVQLLIVYFALPNLIGIELSPFFAGALSLGNCSAACIAEIVRAGINALPSGQWEASEALGYSTYATIKYIIVPQLFAHIIPELFNEFISIVLCTPVISHIGAFELTKAGANIIAYQMNPFPVYTALVVLYLLITTFILSIAKYLEWRFCNGFR